MGRSSKYTFDPLQSFGPLRKPCCHPDVAQFQVEYFLIPYWVLLAIKELYKLICTAHDQPL